MQKTTYALNPYISCTRKITQKLKQNNSYLVTQYVLYGREVLTNFKLHMHTMTFLAVSSLACDVQVVRCFAYNLHIS